MTEAVPTTDKILPTIKGCPTNITVNAGGSCDAIATWTAPTFTDNCTGGTLTSTKSPGASFSKGNTVVTYTATDASGNTATCSFTVTVNDKASPVITGCPSDIIMNAGNGCNAVVNWTPPGFTDNCPGATIVSSKEPGTSFPVGPTTVTYRLTDASGNIATCSFKVTVVDKTPPVLNSCPSDIIVSADENCSAIVEWTEPIAFDNCSVSSNLSQTHKPGDVFQLGETLVTYTAKDVAGNVSYCAFRITVKNESDVTISDCPSDILLDATEDGGAIATWTEPSALDGCGEVNMIGSHKPGTFFGIGETEVVYTIAGDAGRQSFCSFRVIVNHPLIEIDVSKIITPDGNGVNDEWVLTNIEKFKLNEVIVFDRWGSVIFKAVNYDNENIVWRGSNGSGGAVPTGTYFYSIIIEAKSGRTEKRGFIELIR
jgi:gliding motility-associated-like protein